MEKEVFENLLKKTEHFKENLEKHMKGTFSSLEKHNYSERELAEIIEMNQQTKEKVDEILDIMDRTKSVISEEKDLSLVKNVINEEKNLSLVNGIEEQIENLKDYSEQVSTIMERLKTLSLQNTLLSLNASIEMSRMREDEKRKKAFEETKKSSVFFQRPTVTSTYENEMKRLKKERLDLLRKEVVRLIQQMISPYRDDFMETNGVFPSFISFGYNTEVVGAYNCMEDYVNDYPIQEDSDGVKILTLRNIQFWDQNNNPIQTAFYIPFEKGYRSMETLVKEVIETELLKEKELTMIEFKEAFGEERFNINK